MADRIHPCTQRPRRGRASCASSSCGRRPRSSDEVGDANAVSVRAIARRAGVSPTALYLQFPDRDALVAAAVDDGFEAFNAALMDAAAVPAEPRERLQAMGRAYLEFSVRQPALYAILFSARRPLIDKPLTPRDQAFDGLVALLREHDPALDAESARELALVVWSSLHGYAMLRTVRPHFDWPAPGRLPAPPAQRPRARLAAERDPSSCAGA